jgi:hypothetical protein
MSIAPEVAVIESSASHVLLSQSNILIALWYGPQEPDVCRRLYDVAVQIAKAKGTGKCAAVSILRGRVATPSPAAREALARLHHDPEQVIHRSALVFAKAGFIASIVRSVALSVRQHASRRDNHDIFMTVESALDWVIQGLPAPRGVMLSTDALLSAIEQQDTQRLASVA